MKESGDELEIENDRGTIHAETLVRERSGHVHNQLAFFSKDGWSRAQLKYDPFIAHNRHEESPYKKYEFRRDHKTKLVPTAECYGLEVLEIVNASVGRTLRDDAPPEDLWPNFNAMVAKLQQIYIESHEDSPSDNMRKRYRVLVMPRLSAFDAHQCATTPIPAGVQTVSRKTFLRNEQGRRVAEVEHNFTDDRDSWSVITEGARWTWVSVFRLAGAVEPRVVRTGKGRATGTGYSKPFVQPSSRASHGM